MLDVLFRQRHRSFPSRSLFQQGRPQAPAILFLHGLTGGPQDFSRFVQPWQQAGWRIHAPVLPGHGTSPRAMLTVDATTMQNAADRALANLLRMQHEQVIVCGLSQGSLLAIRTAARFSVPLVVLAPPTSLPTKQLSFLSFLQSLALLDQFIWHKTSGGDVSIPDQQQVPWSYDWFPLRAIVTLHRLIIHARAALPLLAGLPVFWAHGRQDHTASWSGSLQWYKALPAGGQRQWFDANNSWHILPRDRDQAPLSQAVFDFCQQRVRDEIIINSHK